MSPPHPGRCSGNSSPTRAISFAHAIRDVSCFNGKLRDELLDREVFDTLLEAKVLISRWRKAYNTVRPHSSLGYRPPAPESRRPCPLAEA
jgi:transposase InsO family protein